MGHDFTLLDGSGIVHLQSHNVMGWYGQAIDGLWECCSGIRGESVSPVSIGIGSSIVKLSNSSDLLLCLVVALPGLLLARWPSIILFLVSRTKKSYS